MLLARIIEIHQTLTSRKKDFHIRNFYM